MRLRRPNFNQSIEKTEEQEIQMTDPLVFVQIFSKSMKNSFENKQLWAAIVTDFLRTFDCICFDVLITKLTVCGFDKKT